MKRLYKRQNVIVAIAIILIILLVAIVITKNMIKNNSKVANEKYLATIANANSNLVASCIQKGITIGGITGTLEVLDTSDATATPEDIAEGKTAYVNGVKITGTYKENEGTPVNELKVGDTVYYDTGNTTIGDNGVIECVVLWDSSSGYGVQIISSDVIYINGKVDTVTLDSGSYNSAVSLLNKKTEDYLNEQDKTEDPLKISSVRCVGSLPSNKGSEPTNMFYKSASWFNSYNSRYKVQDENYLYDYNQMNSLGIKKAGSTYWLASRYIQEKSYLVYIYIRNANNNGDMSYGYGVFNVDSSGATKYLSYTYGIRPVFTLKEGATVTEGKGSSILYKLSE